MSVLDRDGLRSGRQEYWTLAKIYENKLLGKHLALDDLDTLLGTSSIASQPYLLAYSRTSVGQTLIAHLTRLFRTRFLGPLEKNP